MTFALLHALLPEPIVLLFVGTLMLALGNMHRRTMNPAAGPKEPVKR